MSQDTPTWEPLRELMAARLPGCTVTLDKPQLLSVYVPYSDSKVVVLHLGEPVAAEKLTPDIIENKVSHIFCVGFHYTYDDDKWPPERLQSLIGGPFERYARGTARHFAEVIPGRAMHMKDKATQYVLRVAKDKDDGIVGPEQLDSALRHREGVHAVAEEMFALARAYRALADTDSATPAPSLSEPTP